MNSNYMETLRRKKKHGKTAKKILRLMKKNSGAQLVPSSPEQGKLERNERGLHRQERERLKKKTTKKRNIISYISY